MKTNVLTAAYILIMVAIVVAVDVAFFRHSFWERLAVNIVVVLVFALLYVLCVKHLLS